MRTDKQAICRSGAFSNRFPGSSQGTIICASTSQPLILFERENKALLTSPSQHCSLLCSSYTTILRIVIFCLRCILPWIQHNPFNTGISRTHAVSFYQFWRPSLYFSSPSFICIKFPKLSSISPAFLVRGCHGESELTSSGGTPFYWSLGLQNHFTNMGVPTASQCQCWKRWPEIILIRCLCVALIPAQQGHPIFWS